MSSLRNKTILIISPNEWGTVRVSKHHYAMELAERGNRVLFLNPPDAGAISRIKIEPTDVVGLSIVTYRPFVPFALRFKWRALFNIISSAHARWIVRRLGSRIDVVWCFDVNLYSDLRWFGAPVRIFHPVDQVVEAHQRSIASTASLVLSVSDEILKNVRDAGVRSQLVGHGLGAAFAARANTDRAKTTVGPMVRLRVGYVGNLLIPYLDRYTIRELVANHPTIEFNFWGPSSAEESNIGGRNSAEVVEFVEFLRSHRNVILHGKQSSETIAERLHSMDLMLICYATANDPNRGCNSHKILEYLSTGRVIVSSHVPDYSHRPELIRMMPTLDNTDFPALFAETVHNIETLNNEASRQTRIRFALENTYSNQVDRIEELLDSGSEIAASVA
jgi:glycosyltransferase involved in cell wall biosynthesis